MRALFVWKKNKRVGLAKNKSGRGGVMNNDTTLSDATRLVHPGPSRPPQSVNPSSIWRKLREYSVRELEGLLFPL